ncbi:hypothetical protein EXIGLDRAFT_722584, partial [Exidia glandulosa HHB12029]
MLTIHAHSPSPHTQPPDAHIILQQPEGTLRVSLHERDAEEVCAKGWAHPVSHRFVLPMRRDRHEVELYDVPRDAAELAVVLEIVEAGVKYLRSQAADMLCNEIL